MEDDSEVAKLPLKKYLAKWIKLGTKHTWIKMSSILYKIKVKFYNMEIITENQTVT